MFDNSNQPLDSDNGIVLMESAIRGFFPKSFRNLPQPLPSAEEDHELYTRKNYRIRHPILEDMHTLLRLEEECWAEGMRSSAEVIKQRVLLNPRGQCLLEMDSKTVGIIYSQRVKDIAQIRAANDANVHLLHDETGSLIQLLAINIFPDLQLLGLGDELLAFMVNYSFLRPGVSKVMAVTRCKNYALHRDMEMEAYIRTRNNQGLLLDPILRFHDEHGASIDELIPNYRAHDDDNNGTGVVISYDPIRGTTEKSVISKSTSPPSYKEVIDLLRQSVTTLLEGGRFDKDRVWLEMGLGSLDLYGLRLQLAEQLNINLDATLFFRYATPEAIAQFLSKPQESAPPKQLKRAMPSSAASLPADSDGIRRKHLMGISGEALAVIGMACRMGGSINSLADFWRMLRDGEDGIVEVPASRYDINAYYHPEPGRPGSLISRYGSFIDNVGDFDNEFFNINPREAAHLDPSQRILLEVAWQALEDACVDPERLKGTKAGIFTGVFSSDYERLQLREQQGHEWNAYFATGNCSSMTAGRLSYFLGFQGPAIAVNTACSSSLVAIHLAARSLLNGECNVALAGGVNLILSPDLSIAFSRAGMLSPDGRCKTFDRTANGYVRGEGCGMVVLKPLHQALAANDRIQAIFRGAAINQDGASNGLTAPNGHAQESVIKEALSAAGIAAKEVSYVEAHGTGTPLGDPIEFNALRDTYGQGRDWSQPLYLGSLKTNIGHAEAAAGVLGLIKVILAFEHRSIPKNLHFKTANPLISLDQIPAEIPINTIPWPTFDDKPRLAAVSSFGFSGTNAHLIIQEGLSAKTTGHSVSGHQILALSAKNQEALGQLVGDFAQFLEKDVSLASVCISANMGRAHFPERVAVTASNRENMRQALLNIRDVREPKPAEPTSMVFLFTGQGSQYPNMGSELFEQQPVFRRAIEQCDEILHDVADIHLLDSIYPEFEDFNKLDQTAVTQPALFALEYALYQLWKSWGIEPQAVLGHSVGEYVAAHVAGIFSLEDGLKLIAARGRLMQQLPSGGAMAAVMTSEDIVVDVLQNVEDVSIAAFNAPMAQVISGREAEVDAAIDIFKERGVKTQKLKVSHAFHSSLMDPILKSFEQEAARLQFSPPKMAFISSATGREWIGTDIQPQYWCHQLRQAVMFRPAMQRLERLGYNTFLELGPQPVLSSLGRRSVKGECVFLPSLRQGASDMATMLGSLSTIYQRGSSVHFPGLYRREQVARIAVPGYPFQRRSFWFERAVISRPRKVDSSLRGTHPLLGNRLRTAVRQKEVVFDSRLFRESEAFLGDYCVGENVLLPATACLEMARAAGAIYFDRMPIIMEDVTFIKDLRLPENGEVQIQFILEPLSPTHNRFGIYSLTEEQHDQSLEFEENVKGTLAAPDDHPTPENLDLAHLQSSLPMKMTGVTLYQNLEQSGMKYGASLRTIKHIWYSADQALCQMSIAEGIHWDEKHYAIHPALLMGAIQLVELIASRSPDSIMIPCSLSRMIIYSHAQGNPYCIARLSDVGAELEIVNEDGSIVAQIEGLALKEIRVLAQEKASWRDWLMQKSWQPAKISSKQPPNQEGVWLLYCDDNPAGLALAKELRQSRQQCFLVGTGTKFDRPEPQRFLVPPDKKGAFERLFSILKEEGHHLSGVVLLAKNGGDPCHAYAATGTALMLTKALLAEGNRQLPHVHFITQGACRVDDMEQLPGHMQAPLLGLAHVLSLEHPELLCSTHDVDANIDMVQWGVLSKALITEMPVSEENTKRERFLAWRKGTAFVKRLVPCRLPVGAAYVPDPNANYLIAGGLSTLGLSLAQYLVEKGARHLVLTTLRGRRPEAEEALRKMAEAGAHVLTPHMDVTKIDQVTNLFEGLNKNLPLKGVFHAAGVLDDGIIASLTPERMERVMEPKLTGAWNLHQATEDLNLDCFVSFSSIASLLGSSGQANYTAANRYLDALSEHRRSLNLPALSVNWCAIKGSGMAGEGNLWKLRGLQEISTHEAWDLLLHAIPTGITCLGVAPILPQAFEQTWTNHSMFELIRPTLSEKAETPDLREQLEAATESERNRILSEWMRIHLSEILGVKSAMPLSRTIGFSALGMDSLAGIEFRNHLQARLHMSLSSTLTFDYPTMESLSAFLLELLFGKKKEPISAKPLEQAEDILGDDLSAEDIDDLLKAELEELQKMGIDI